MNPDYLPRPKVVAAVLSAVLVVALLAGARAAGVDLEDWAAQLLVVAAAGLGGYVKSDSNDASG